MEFRDIFLSMALTPRNIRWSTAVPTTMKLGRVHGQSASLPGRKGIAVVLFGPRCMKFAPVAQSKRNIRQA